MILFVSTFDVDEPEGPPKSSYLSLKDVKIIFAIIVVLSLFMVPIYVQMREGRNQHLCYQNLSQISKAIGVYASQNDDRLPPTYVEDGPAPMVDAQGHPFTWASLIAGNMNSRSSFRCDSAKQEEITYAQGAMSSKNAVPMTYGMYSVYGGYPIAHIGDPDKAALIAETSNFGASDTYDPVPFIARNGKPVTQDGFLIGFSDGNDGPTKKSAAVTRLAFPGTKNGNFVQGGPSRHKDGIYYLTVSGSILMAKPSMALTKPLSDQEIPGIWAVPPASGR